MKTSIRLAMLVAGAYLPGQALAQDAQRGVVLDTITVTAQKRTANSRDVPASLAVETGSELRLRDIRWRDDALADVPNVETGAVTARLYTSFVTIRGVGSPLIESDPAVGLYLDGTGIGSTQAYSGTLLDVERVEILRGPQGTLYGRNNLAGSVNILSRRPDPRRLAGEVGVDYGKYGNATASGVLNVPLGNQGWAARMALSATRVGGPLRSSVDGSRLNGGNDRHGRLSVQGDISDRLEFLGILEAENHHLNGEMFGMPEADFEAGSNQVAIAEPSRIRSRLLTSSAHLTYDLGDGDKLVSHTGYQRNTVDVSGNGFPVGYFAAYDAMFQAAGLPDFRYRSDNPYDGHYRQWSQELRYVSQRQTGFDWVAGLYAEFANASRAYGAGSRFTGGEATVQSQGRTRTRSVSAFADGTYDLSAHWKLLGGVRLGHDRKQFDYTFDANASATMLGLAAPFAPSYTDSLRKTYLTPRIGLQFTPAEGLNLYGTISSGYKSGGFNAGLVGVGDEGAYNAETLVSYEVGVKSLWLNDRLGVDASVFYIDWRNQQIQGYNPLTGATPMTNAPRSRSVGGELSAQLRLDQHWSLRAGIGYADAIYRDYPEARAPSGQGTIDASGHRQQFVSRLTGRLGVDYQWNAGSGWVGKAGAAYRVRSSYYFDVQNTQRQPGFGLLDLYAGLENDRYALFLHARNVGDVRYRTLAGDLGGGTLVNVGEPLTIAASVRIKF